VTAVPPPPPPDSIRPIQLPADQYFHPSAPTEWWWHTGTLTANGKTFGFEINAAGFGQLLFSQIMLTDVANKVHYSQVALYPYNPAWAQSDVTKDWYVNLPYPAAPSAASTPYVTMNAPQSDPTKNMAVKALLIDDVTKKVVTFDLTLSQQGPPMLIWGTGIKPSNPGGYSGNNFYYSFTRLQASGSISIDGVSHAVEGVTWMDHEFGFFGTPGNPIKWILQDMQLDNGVTISNYAIAGNAPLLMNQPTASQATMQFADGTTYFVNTFLTPRGATWVSPVSKKLYYLEFQVDIPSFNASIIVTTLLPDQEFTSTIKILDFPILVTGEVYEGVATASGTFLGQAVSGTAWNEQTPG
jgi:predicted secreted hydrolase